MAVFWCLFVYYFCIIIDIQMNNLPVFLAVFPFLVFVVVLLWGKVSLLKASAVTLALFAVLSVFYWEILPSLFFISLGKGFFIALDIFIIILGAIFFLSLLERLSVIKNISYYLEHFSSDYRLQIILLAWLFEAFIEGTAGFGTPVAIVAPLLVGLGLTPIKALIVALMGNSSAVVFGAAGTPIKVGFAGLETASLPLISALINCIGFIVPVFMLWVITAGRKNRWGEFRGGLPFAIWSGIAFVVPSVFCVFLGQEFPSIVGSLIGIILVYASTKMGFFVPKEQITLMGVEKLNKTMSATKAFLPYGLLVIALILGKIFLSGYNINISLGFSHLFNLFNPGFAFILTGILVALIWRSNIKEVAATATQAFRGAVAPSIVIVLMSILVQLMTNSGQNSSGLPSAIALLAKIFETNWLPFFAPFLSAFGSFVTGSATISNIMFGNFLNTAASSLGLGTSIILSLAVVGGATGNMIALADMLAGQAVLGLKNKEREVLKGVIVPCLILLALSGVIGLILVFIS